MTVDLDTQVVIDAEPVGNPSDSGQPAPTAERVAPLLDVRPPAATAPPVQAPAVTLVADAGYSSANDALACEELGFIPVFPVMRTVNPQGSFFNRTDFTHDADATSWSARLARR